MMNHEYRCYFLDSGGRFKDLAEFVSPDDVTAIAMAQQRFAGQRDYAGFELWTGGRCVFVRPPGSQAALP